MTPSPYLFTKQKTIKILKPIKVNTLKCCYIITELLRKHSICLLVTTRKEGEKHLRRQIHNLSTTPTFALSTGVIYQNQSECQEKNKRKLKKMGHEYIHAPQNVFILKICVYLFMSAAWAAANLAIGTRNGEQLT